MNPKNIEKTKDVIKELEKTISPLLVINNKSLKPYIELFDYAPENVYQQPLGNLIGFFEIREYSETSAYIVNFLTSVIKKEYYINPKRSVSDSLDAALHKVNLALSEVAKHGNIEWLGKLNGAAMVLEKNSAHFSVAGHAKIFLSRKQIFTEITEGLASNEPEPHPLKTFVNVSSGRIEKDDRLIITSSDIFHILPFNHLKKNVERFKDDKFTQFIKTALSNQLEMIACLIVDVKEKKKQVQPRNNIEIETEELNFNAFSEKTYFKEHTDSKNEAAGENFNQQDSLEKESPEYIDEKTGHIYVQGRDADHEEISPFSYYLEIATEKFSVFSANTKNGIRRNIAVYKRKIEKRREHQKAQKELQKIQKEEEKQRLAEERKIAEEEQKRMAEEENILKEKIKKEQQLRAEREAALEAEKLIGIKTAAEIEIKESLEDAGYAEIKIIKQQKKIVPATETQQRPIGRKLTFREKLALARMDEDIAQKAMLLKEDSQKRNFAFESESEDARNEIKTATKTEPAAFEESEEMVTYPFKRGGDYAEKEQDSEIANHLEDFSIVTVLKLKNILKTLASLIDIAFSRIKEIAVKNKETAQNSANASKKTKLVRIFSSLSQKQKAVVTGAIFLIFVVPIFIARWLNGNPPVSTAPIENTPPSMEQLMSGEKNMQFLSVASMVYSANQPILAETITDQYIVALTSSSVITMQNGSSNEFKLPEGSGNATKISYMKDLALLLIKTDANKIISFSPVSQKFSDNTIDLGNTPATSPIGSYLTYLYVLDAAKSQVYRYPRATGGFGEKADWIKDDLNFNEASDMAIDDNVYILKNNSLLKLFKGKKVDFSLDQSKTAIEMDNIFTKEDYQSIYILDRKHDRIVQYSKTDGTIQKQFFNEAFGKASSFAVDEINATAYISLGSSLSSLKLQ